MRIIDNLPDVLDLLDNESDRFSFWFRLTGIPTQTRYPNAIIQINDVPRWQGIVKATQEIYLDDIEILLSHLDIKLIYHDKTDHDTVVENGTIVENQHLIIESIKINQIEISNFDLYEFSVTNYDLNENQKKAFASLNEPWKNVRTDRLFNNGTWQMKFERPILNNFLKLKKIPRRQHEVSHYEILRKLQNYYLDR